jgi:hypothetical protein
MERTHLLVDIDQPDTLSADDVPAPAPGARRRLLGAGLLGLAASVAPSLAGRASASGPRPGADDTTTTAAGSTTSAGPTTTLPPKRPTATDTALLAFAQQVELAAVALYEVAIAGTALGDSKPYFQALRESHRAYAQSLSAQLGKTAPGAPLTDVVTKLTPAFSAATLAEVAKAAYDLEATAVATHEELIGTLQGTNGAALVASVLVAEARHLTVLADIGGATDLDTLLLSNATALTPTKG